MPLCGRSACQVPTPQQRVLGCGAACHVYIQLHVRLEQRCLKVLPCQSHVVLLQQEPEHPQGLMCVPGCVALPHGDFHHVAATPAVLVTQSVLCPQPSDGCCWANTRSVAPARGAVVWPT